MRFLTRKAQEAARFLHIRKLHISQLPLLMAETFLLILSASFVNACSELFFANGAQPILEKAADHPLTSVVTLCLIPAVIEETLFRGIILRIIKGPVKSILLSALLFAIWHLNPDQMTYAFLAGLMLGLMALWLDNLLCTMITHMLFNLYNLLAVILPAGTAAGKVMAFSERIIGYLIPPLKSPEGVFLTGNFFIGLLTFLLSTSLYIFILYKSSTMQGHLTADI